MNDDLNKQVFDAIQRGYRLAGKLGYADLEAAEAALATQLDSTQEESQRAAQELSQRHSSEELAEYAQALQAELAAHVRLSRSTLEALGDALNNIAALREENCRLLEELELEKEKAGSHEDEAKAEEVGRERTEGFLPPLSVKYRAQHDLMP